MTVNDNRLKAFVRDGYEWTRQSGFARIGYIGDGQGCGLGRLIGLAVKLSNAGVGDYWEDVDQYIRNQGTEMQVVPEDREYLESLVAGKPPPPKMVGFPGDVRSTDHVIDRAIGGFAGHITKDCVWNCCSPHGNMGLFYAWDGMLSYENGTARINLFLNRASPELDLYSYLPYEGKVVLKNKYAKEAFLRIPLWVDRAQVRCKLGPRTIENVWLGNYLRVENLKPEDVVTIEFPMKETVEKWTVPKLHRFLSGPPSEEYTCRFRGNTLVEITPALFGSPLYHTRPKLYQSTQAPMMVVTRFVTPKTLKW